MRRLGSTGGLSDPAVRGTAVLYALARLPGAAVWLSIVLDVSAATGSYARAGLAVGAYGVGVAVGAPVLGGLADRHGGRRVLLLCAALQLPALLALWRLDDGAVPVLLSAGAVAGLVQPPLVACMRAAWSQLVPDEQARKACLSFDAVLGEVVDLVAPLLAVLVHTQVRSTGSLPVVAGASCAAAVAFAVVTPLRTGSPSRARLAWRLPRRTVAVLVVIGLLTAALGAVEIGVLAAADAAGRRSAVGWMLALFAVTSIVGGLAHSRRPVASRPTAELSTLLAFLTVLLLATAAVSSSLPATAALLAVAGVVVAPLVAVLLGLIESTAEPGGETAAFTWATSANFLGVSLGGVLAGKVVDVAPPEMGAAAGLGTAAALAYLAVAAVPLLLAATARRPRPRDGEADERAALLAELEQLESELLAVDADNQRLERDLASAGRSR